MSHKTLKDTTLNQQDATGQAEHSFEHMKRTLDAIQALEDNSVAITAYRHKHAVTVDDLAYFQDAFSSGGDEGLRIASSPDILPMRLARRASTLIRNTLSAHFAGRKALRITDEGQAIGIYEIRYNITGSAYLFPIAQLRLATATRHWHLYWLHQSGVWWPYEPPTSGRYRFTLKTRLQQIVDDRFGRFWRDN